MLTSTLKRLRTTSSRDGSRSASVTSLVKGLCLRAAARDALAKGGVA